MMNRKGRRGELKRVAEEDGEGEGGGEVRTVVDGAARSGGSGMMKGRWREIRSVEETMDYQ